MAFKVVITDTAREELRAALKRLSIDFESPSSASRLGTEFRCLIPMLVAFPRSKPIDFPASELFGKEIRRAQVRNYLAYYSIDDEKETISIVSFLAMKQDQIEHLARDYSQTI